MITVKHYKGQSSILQIQIRLSEKHLNISQTRVFSLPHTGAATFHSPLLTISEEKKDHEMENRKSYSHLCISQCHFWTGTFSTGAGPSKGLYFLPCQHFVSPTSPSWVPPASVQPAKQQCPFLLSLFIYSPEEGISYTEFQRLLFDGNRLIFNYLSALWCSINSLS